MPFEAFELQEQDETGEFHNAYLDFMQNNHTFDDFIDRKKEKAAKKKLDNTLNAFIDEESDEITHTGVLEEFEAGNSDDTFLSTDQDEKSKKTKKKN
jgi:hypothetical protein